jgi:hypothetical protein
MHWVSTEAGVHFIGQATNPMHSFEARLTGCRDGEGTGGTRSESILAVLTIRGRTLPMCRIPQEKKLPEGNHDRLTHCQRRGSRAKQRSISCLSTLRTVTRWR